MTRRGRGAADEGRGAFLAEFVRTAGGVRGFRLYTDRLVLRLDGGGRTRRRTLRLAGIAGADVIAAGQGATLRIVGPAGPLDVEMLSSWEATLASELIAGLRDIADVQAGRSGDDRAPGAPGPARSRRARRSRRTRARVTLSRTAARPLAVASEREG